MPPSLEERIAYLEGKVDEHSRGFDDLRASTGRIDDHVVALDGKVDRFRDELGARIDGLGSRMDALGQKVDRFRDELSARIDGLGSRIDAMEPRFTALGSRIDALDQKVDRFREELDAKMSRQFTWLVGIQVTVLVAVLGLLIR